VKFKSVTQATGILSQNTWSVSDQIGGITQGATQATRLGLEIRLRRMRVVISFSEQASQSNCGFSFLDRLDPTVSGSDIFGTNGLTRAELDYPNPAVVNRVYSHVVNSAEGFTGAAHGTTPSYSSVTIVVDHDFGQKGKLVRYDLAGAVVGPLPMVWYITNETSISAQIGTQLWFTDA
jgi:hypothetical protein